jgi:hypothetical protein
LAEQVFEQLTYSVVGKKLVLIQVDGQGLYKGAVLHRLVHAIRKGCPVRGAADMAGLLFCPVFGCFQLEGR